MARDKGLLQQITGNVGKDPETQESKVGDIVKFSVAVTLRYGEDPITRWVQVALFDERRQDDRDGELSPLQRRVLKGVEKGSKVAVEGTITSKEKDGKTYYDMIAKRVGIVEWFKRDDNGSFGKASSKKKAADEDEDEEEGIGW